MATLVFRSSAGPLIQTQVGAADLVATVQAAQSAYGWLSGLDSVRFLISTISNKFTPGATKLQNLPLDRKLKLFPTRAHVLTSVGPQELFINNAEQCFGEDVRTQLIGLSICALAHVVGGDIAVRLFTKHLLPRMFDAPPELLHSVELQLSDKMTLTKILNEGASRDLTRIFTDAISSSSVPWGNWRRLTNIDDYSQEMGDDMELNFVRGVLVWIGEDSTATYFTRSGLAARVAICLQAIGYMIGRVESWDGSGSPPSALDPNSVMLVLGGSHPTDPLSVFENDMRADPFEQNQYYTVKTVGSLLYNSFGVDAPIYPERLQDDFEYVRRYIMSRVQVKWRPLWTKDDGRSNVKSGFETPYLAASCVWQDTVESSSTERALASIYFPSSSDLLAPCYRRIESDSMLQTVRRAEESDLDLATFDLSDCEWANEFLLFRAITACIVIGLTSCLAPNYFTTVQHQTLLQLSNRSWLEHMCPGIDRLASSNLSLPMAVYHLAAIHAGYSTLKLWEVGRTNAYQRRVIGYRSGVFSVLPKLLLHMEPTPESVGLSCNDRFFANLLHTEDGTIEDTQTATRTIWGNAVGVRQVNNLDEATSSPVNLREPWTGPFQQRAPDRPLYLSLERHTFGKPNQVALVGRIDGKIVGETGILQTLWTLLRSSDEAKSCTHRDSIQVHNIRASYWGRDRYKKPFGSMETPLYVQVQGDSCWALLVAGESMFHNSVVVNHCTVCAYELLQSIPTRNINRGPGILIGFGGK